MEISTKKKDGWNIVSINGRIVIREIKNIRDVFESLEKEPDPHVAIDFSKTVYIDSSSITLLLNFKKRIQNVNGLLVGFGPNKDIMDIFSIVHLDEYIDIYNSRTEFEKEQMNKG